jgi:hypothetical protein
MVSAVRKQQRRDRWYRRRSRYREERKYRYQNSERTDRPKSGGTPEEPSMEPDAEVGGTHRQCDSASARKALRSRTSGEACRRD